MISYYYYYYLKWTNCCLSSHSLQSPSLLKGLFNSLTPISQNKSIQSPSSGLSCSRPHGYIYHNSSVVIAPSSNQKLKSLHRCWLILELQLATLAKIIMTWWINLLWIRLLTWLAIPNSLYFWERNKWAVSLQDLEMLLRFYTGSRALTTWERKEKNCESSSWLEWIISINKIIEPKINKDTIDAHSIIINKCWINHFSLTK